MVNNNILKLIEELENGIYVQDMEASQIANHMSRGVKIPNKEMLYNSSLQALNLMKQDEFYNNLTNKNGMLHSDDIIKVRFSKKQKDAKETKKDELKHNKTNIEKAQKKIEELEKRQNEIIKEIHEYFKDKFEDMGVVDIVEDITPEELNNMLKRWIKTSKNTMRKAVTRAKVTGDKEKIKRAEDNLNRIYEIDKINEERKATIISKQQQQDVIAKREARNKTFEELEDNAEGYISRGKKDLRLEFQENGFWIENEETGVKKHYSFMKRTSSQSRVGTEYYLCDGILDENGKLIPNKMFKANEEWFSCGLHEMMKRICDKDPNATVDLVSVLCYEAMVDSGCERYMNIDPESILVIPDIEAYCNTKGRMVYRNGEGWLEVEDAQRALNNVLFDGQSLLDKSMYVDINGNEIKESMALTRNHFFKSAGFKTDIQGYFKDYCKKNGIDYNKFYVEDVFGNKILAKNVRMITTTNSTKIMKVKDIFKEAEGWDDKRIWEEWKKLVKKDGNLFGVVKTEHPSKFGDYQRSAYQHFNTMGLSKEEIKVVMEDWEKEFLEKLANDEATFIQYLKDTDGYMNQNKTVLAIIEQNPGYIETKDFGDFKKSVKSDYVKQLKKGKVKICGDNLTLFGNGAEMLRMSTGEMDDFIEDIGDKYRVGLKKGYVSPELKKCKDAELSSCWTKQFENEANITAFRSPHATDANIGFLKNRCGSKEAEIYDKYFDLSPNIVVVDLTQNPLQATLQGADQDSDFIMATNNKQVFESSRRRVGKSYIVDNGMKPIKSKYRYTPKDIAELNHILADSQKNIGMVANYSQIAVSQNNHYKYILSLKDGKERNELLKQINMTLEEVVENQKSMSKIVEILSVMEGMAIDSAKKQYFTLEDIYNHQGFGDQLEQLKKQICWIKQDDKIVAPEFFKRVAPDNKLPRMKMHTPMDYLQDVVDEINPRATSVTRNLTLKDILKDKKEYGFDSKKVKYDKVKYFEKEVERITKLKNGYKNTIEKFPTEAEEINKLIKNFDKELDYLLTRTKGKRLSNNEVYCLMSRLASGEYKGVKNMEAEVEKTLLRNYSKHFIDCIKEGEGKLPSSEKAIDKANKLIDVFQVKGERVAKDINVLYNEMIEDLNNDIEKIYYNNIKGMTKDEAKAYMDEVISTEQYNLLKDRLPENAKARISRIELLKQEITYQCGIVGGLAHDKMSNLFAEVIEESYARYFFNESKNLKLGLSFTRVPKRTITALLEGAFYDDKRTLKQRTGKNIEVNTEKLTEILFKGIMEGRSPQWMANNLHEQGQHSIASCRQIIRTEVTHYANEGTMLGMEELGLEKYIFIATLDSRTSTICRDLDGKVFEVSERKVGVNLPPMHPNCRSTTISYYDEATLSSMKRRARDKDGKSIIVDGNMTYKEYYEKFLKED